MRLQKTGQNSEHENSEFAAIGKDVGSDNLHISQGKTTVFNMFESFGFFNKETILCLCSTILFSPVNMALYEAPPITILAYSNVSILVS